VGRQRACLRGKTWHNRWALPQEREVSYWKITEYFRRLVQIQLSNAPREKVVTSFAHHDGGR